MQSPSRRSWRGSRRRRGRSPEPDAGLGAGRPRRERTGVNTAFTRALAHLDHRDKARTPGGPAWTPQRSVRALKGSLPRLRRSSGVVRARSGGHRGCPGTAATRRAAVGASRLGLRRAADSRPRNRGVRSGCPPGRATAGGVYRSRGKPPPSPDPGGRPRGPATTVPRLRNADSEWPPAVAERGAHRATRASLDAGGAAWSTRRQAIGMSPERERPGPWGGHHRARPARPPDAMGPWEVGIPRPAGVSQAGVLVTGGLRRVRDRVTSTFSIARRVARGRGDDSPTPDP